MPSLHVSFSLQGIVKLLSCPYRAFDFALHISLGDGVALIIELFTTAEAQLDLCSASFEIELEWDECKPFGGHFACQLVDLASMEEQFAVAHWIVVVAVAMFINGDVCVLQP